MKSPSSDLPVGKVQARRKASKLAPLIALIILLTIPLYFPSITRDPFKKLVDTPIPHAAFQETIGLISEAQAPQSEQHAREPCSAGSAQCHGGEKAVDHPVAPAKKKHEKVRRKRMKKGRSGGGKESISSRKEEERVIKPRVSGEEHCNLFSGEWVGDPKGPYYTNETCNAIQEHQNCLKFGRPDTGFLKWRWKPDDCQLQLLDPPRFLKLVSGKSLAFVGDSVARNHMQSLICLLSRVEKPVDVSNALDQNRQYEFREHDFNISMFWSPYLVNTEKTDPNDDKRPFKLFLDEFDPLWTSKIAPFDFLILSAGHWFFRPTYFYLHHRPAGCLYCPDSNLTHLNSYFSYRRAFRTAFRAINAAPFRGVAFLRTYAPSHYEGAAWDKGGNCARTRPYRRNEVALEDYGLKMYKIQLDELRIAQRAGRRTGRKFRLFDTTAAMLMRPDGHPSKYGHWQGVNQTFANDCVHWCLPGPIDAWNDFLQELLLREVVESERGK